MIDVLSVLNMKKSDEQTMRTVASGKELMKRAGEGVFRAFSWSSPVAIVCGSGNNAGDGYALALCLQNVGIRCTIFLLQEKFSPDGKYYYQRCREARIPIQRCTQETEFSSFKTIVDCIFGIGFSGIPDDFTRGIIAQINRSGRPVISVDINSGLNAENGLGHDCVRSELTVAIGGFKPGHFLNDAKDVIRRKISCDIGIRPAERPFALIEQKDVKQLLPLRKNNSHKANYGYIALIGGSLRYSGAIRLSALANAAMRSGSGVVTVASPKSICFALIPEILESTVFPLSESEGEYAFVPEEMVALSEKYKVIAFGMGMGNTPEVQSALRYLLKVYEGILILDADGLNALASIGVDTLQSARARIVLTPHCAEFSRICGKSTDEILASPVLSAKEFAGRFRVTLLLKGPTTIVTDGEQVYLTDRGCSGMATAGSGDVLSGILAALCGQQADDLPLTVVCAAYLNGRAGELAQQKTNAISMLASDTVAQIPQAVSECMRE